MKRKKSAKDLKLAEEERRLLEKWEKLPKFAFRQHHEKPSKTLEYRLGSPPGRALAEQPSLATPGGSTSTVNNMRYTGNNVLGVCVMHKSSLVPVFSAEDATDIARMRR
jgi:hypothetical protein